MIGIDLIIRDSQIIICSRERVMYFLLTIVINEKGVYLK